MEDILEKNHWIKIHAPKNNKNIYGLPETFTDLTDYFSQESEFKSLLTKEGRVDLGHLLIDDRLKGTRDSEVMFFTEQYVKNKFPGKSERATSLTQPQDDAQNTLGSKKIGPFKIIYPPHRIEEKDENPRTDTEVYAYLSSLDDSQQGHLKISEQQSTHSFSNMFDITLYYMGTLKK
jgi:hypothetical protein